MKQYSTIRIGNDKAHIFDHVNSCILCGVDRWKYPPFKIYKKLLSLKEMKECFEGYAKRRGRDSSNPYKFTCKLCERKIQKLVSEIK